jgi:hypothetical protein
MMTENHAYKSTGYIQKTLTTGKNEQLFQW